MYADGATLFVEVGPRNILGKLVKSILRKKSVGIVSLDRPGKSDLFGLLDGLAQLASLGVSMDWSALWKGYGEPQNFDDKPKPKMAIASMAPTTTSHIHQKRVRLVEPSRTQNVQPFSLNYRRHHQK